MAQGVIYKITSPSNREYIGQSIAWNARLRKYKNMLCESQVKLYNSFKKYGFNAHKIEVICKCNSEELNIKERYYQELYNTIENGLNCLYTETKIKPRKFSKKTKNKMRLARLGKKLTEETKNKMRLSHSKRNCKHTTDTKIKMANSKKNVSKKTRDKLSKIQSKLIIDTDTGVFYYSANELSKLYGIKRTTLTAQLSGQNKNKTTFKYI